MSICGMSEWWSETTWKAPGSQAELLISRREKLSVWSQETVVSGSEDCQHVTQHDCFKEIGAWGWRSFSRSPNGWQNHGHFTESHPIFPVSFQSCCIPLQLVTFRHTILPCSKMSKCHFNNSKLIWFGLRPLSGWLCLWHLAFWGSVPLICKVKQTSVKIKCLALEDTECGDKSPRYKAEQKGSQPTSALLGAVVLNTCRAVTGGGTKGTVAAHFPLDQDESETQQDEQGGKPGWPVTPLPLSVCPSWSARSYL